MFEAIEGMLKEKELSRIVVAAGGIHYRLHIPLNVYTQLPSVDSSLLLYLSQVIREEAHTLYAFADKQARDLFEVLISLSGIGPKTALAVVGHMEWTLFEKAIVSGDLALLSKIPGVGKKTAERLVVEMKGKFKNFRGTHSGPTGTPSLESDALLALLNLGYSSARAHRAVQAALSLSGEDDLGDLITRALQKI